MRAGMSSGGLGQRRPSGTTSRTARCSLDCSCRAGSRRSRESSTGKLICINYLRKIKHIGSKEHFHFRTHNSKSLEEENLRLFIEKSKEILGIKEIFGREKEKVFRNFSNFPIVLNAIAQLSEKSERSSTKLKPKVKT